MRSEARPSTSTMTLAATGLLVPGRLDVAHLVLRPGEVTVVVGENGAGKSTLLDSLAGILHPQAGIVQLEGRDIRSLDVRERAQRMASLGQGDPPLEDLLVVERIAQGLVPRRGPRALLDAATLTRVDAVANDVDVVPLLQRRLGTLSAGERRRVHLARALVDPAAQVILLDEPFSGLDLRVTRALHGVLRRRAETSIVVVSVHDLTVALTIGDRLLGLRAGSLVVDGALPGALDDDAVRRLYGIADAHVFSADGYVAVGFRVARLGDKV